MTDVLDIEALIGGERLGDSGAKGGTGFSHEKPIEGGTEEWYTPPSIFDELGLEFDLDPCAPAGGLPWIPAKLFYSKPDNGLEAAWPCGGMLWCNPPYGKETEKWLRRMGLHGRGVALVFARTDTDWFHETAATAGAILFLNKRIRFVDRSGKPPVIVDPITGKKKKSGPGAGSMLVAWGADAIAALERMNANPDGQHRGLLIPLSRPLNIESLIG